jgi:hypothetical protein
MRQRESMTKDLNLTNNYDKKWHYEDSQEKGFNRALQNLTSWRENNEKH